MTQITQLAPLDRTLPKSQSDWDRIFLTFTQWQRAIQGMSWQPLTLLNGWAPAASAGQIYPEPAYYVDVSGRLFCRGLIVPGTLTDGTELFSLPFTPSFKVTTLAFGYSGSAYSPARIDITQAGTALIYGVSAYSGSPSVSLDQLNFSLIQ